MKRYIIILSILFSNIVLSQTESENYVKSTKFQQATQNGVVNENDKIETIAYYDGLGRLFQHIAIKSGASAKDIVTPFVYDVYDVNGVYVRKTKEFLPYAVTTSSGNIHSNAINNQATFYNTLKYENTTNPYSEVLFDSSPLNRVLKQAAPGAAWGLDPNTDVDHTIKYEYQTNTYDASDTANNDNVIFFGVSHPNNETEQTSLIFKGHYSTGSLFKGIIKDENWLPNQQYAKDHTMEEFKDKLGLVVLKRTYSLGQSYDTYYVYDDFGNLTYVIPPKASDAIVLTTISSTATLTSLNFSWLDLVQVDQNLAEEYQKKLSEYKNEAILTADLENKYGAQGGFSINKNIQTNELVLNINFSSNEPLSLKTGEVASLKDLGEFNDTELGAIKTENYDYTFLIKNNALVIEGVGELMGLNQSFSSNTTLNYSKNFSWVSLMKVDEKFANNYLLQLNEYPNSDILNVTIENEYGGQGGVHIAVDQNDVISLQMNLNTSTPLAFREGLVVDLGLKRRVPDVVLSTLSGQDYEYEFSIKENALYISGSGVITSASPIFIGTPPTTTSTYEIVSEVVEGLCYIYHYDYKNRVVEKKIPGKGWEYIVYDILDRPVLSQDANLRLEDKWMVIKYDALSRPILGGLYREATNSWTRQALQNNINNQTVFNEQRVTVSVTNEHYYSTNVFPVITELHTVNYYDNYSYNESSLTLPPSSQVYGVQISSATKTLPTATKVRVLGTNQWITTITHYDKKARPIYIASENEYLETLDILETKLDFAGKVLETKSLHSKNGSTPIVTTDTFTYDRIGRLLTQNQQINNQTLQLIVANNYDELGSLQGKKVGNTETNPLQEIDYTYNIRGWLKGINDVDVSDASKLFSFKINYNSPEIAQGRALFNGNISETHWKTANDENKRSYYYNYDALNRITKASYQSGQTLTSLPNNDLENYNLNNISYDKNGNILSLERMGVTEATIPTIDIIDQLTYSYANHSNTLLKVTDVADTAGFKDVNTPENDYMYDVNGNMTSDANKGIILNGITYNHLNLPTSISFGSQGTISYIYDATGIKQEKAVISGEGQNAVGVSTQYAGNYIYEKQIGGVAHGLTTLKFFNHAEGYIEPQTNNLYEYTFQFKDHLGNIRLSFEDMDGNGSINPLTEIKEESNYYPFGLKHKGYNSSIVGSKNNYKTYQGQEFTEGLGLNIHEWKYRVSYPDIGRFWQIDPLADDYVYNSTYAFAENKLGLGVELEGLELGAAPWMQYSPAGRDAGITPSGWQNQFQASKERGDKNINDIFKLFYRDGGTAENLIEHYTFGNAEPKILNREQMLESYPKYSKFFPSISVPLLDFVKAGSLKQGETHNVSIDIVTYAGAAGTLGNFTATLEGKISLNSDGKKEFNGVVIFNDIYDFNPADRPFFAEFQVTIARNFLPGTPFRISGQLPVRQIFGEALKVKSENGLYYFNPIRTGGENMPIPYQEVKFDSN